MFGRDTMLLVAEPSLGQDEKTALADVIDSGWVTMGTRVQAFEQAFAAMHQIADGAGADVRRHLEQRFVCWGHAGFR